MHGDEDLLVEHEDLVEELEDRDGLVVDEQQVDGREQDDEQLQQRDRVLVRQELSAPIWAVQEARAGETQALMAASLEPPVHLLKAC